MRKRPETYSKVGPYIIMETLGVGSFAKVKLCVHQTTLSRYACKIIEKSLIRERMSNVQVQREIAIMSRLRHRNTVSLVSVHSTATKVFIIMELVMGGELFDEIFRLKRLSEPYSRFYFRQLIQGMQYCHAHGIFHRDLKPDNLLVDPSYTLKITDFGLATLKAGAATDGTDSVTSSLNLHTQCGTPNYVAPEIINIDPNGYSGAKVDAWACGIILYVLVAGALPFDSEILPELFKAIVRCDLSYPQFFSECLKDLINNLLKTNPSERYTLADVQQHPWYNGPVESPKQPFSLPMRVPPFMCGRRQEDSPVYPLPEERDHRKYRNLQQPSDGSAGNANNRQSGDSLDSLDFGMRVESVAGGLTMSALPVGLRNLRARLQLTSYTHTIGPNVGQPKPTPPDSYTGDVSYMDKVGNSEENPNKNDMSEVSKYGPDESWVLSDTDRLVWCRMMKDFDMVPDIFEFGMDSATLSEKWQKGLAKEKLRKKSSFASDRFGIAQKGRSRSAQYLASAATRSEVEEWQDPSKMLKGQDHATVVSGKSGSVATVKEVTKSEKGQPLGAGSDMNHQGAVDPVAVASVHVNGAHNDGQVQVAEYDLLLHATLPNPPFSRPSEERMPAGHSPSDIELDSGCTELLPASAHMMGEGQDLLEENEAREDVIGFTKPPKNNRDLDLPMPCTSESQGIADALRNNRNLETKVTAPLTDTDSSPRGNSTPVIAGQENDGHVLSPFAYDVPGPRRALPVTKTLLGSIVPSTVSPRRLLRRSASPLHIKSFTQFHSLLDPSTCFDVIQSVLRDYGCTVTKTSSARSREKFQIRCESKKEDVTVHTRLSIYKVDDVLSTVHFKRLLHTDSKDFTRFYSDISRLYSETLKARGLSEGSARKERQEENGAKVRFENTSCDDTVDDISL